jgi:hypothetical protein
MAVYWVYLSRANSDNVAWPSVKGLARDTEWSVNPCREAREWLVKHKALEKVDGYVRPDWRKLELVDRTRKLNFDKSEYYRPTGILEVGGITYTMLYFGGSEPSDIDEPEPDVSQNDTSEAPDSTSDNSQNDTSESENTGSDVSPHDTSDKNVIAEPDISPGLTSETTHHAQNDTELNIISELSSNASELNASSSKQASPDIDEQGRATTTAGVFQRYVAITTNAPTKIDRDLIPDDIKTYGLEIINKALDRTKERVSQGAKVRSWKYVQPILEELRQPPPKVAPKGSPAKSTPAPGNFNNGAQSPEEMALLEQIHKANRQKKAG